MERELGDRSAGIRTFPLVAIASCAFITGSERVLRGQPEALARIMEGVITGMGFIGGGAILKIGDTVRGTATAASLWATGAIGVSCAIETYDVAAILSAATFITLRLLMTVEGGRNKRKRPKDPYRSGWNDLASVTVVPIICLSLTAGLLPSS